MAEPSKFSGLLQQMGLLSPGEKAAQQQQAQMQQYQTALLARQSAQQSASRYGLFGGPVEQSMARNLGVPQNMQIPGIPQMEDTSAQEGIMSRTMGQAGSYSQSLYAASQELLRMGDTPRAQQAYAAALQAMQEEQEEMRKQEKAYRDEVEFRAPKSLATVGVEGDPRGRQQLGTQYNPETGRIEQTNLGHSYQIGEGVNVNFDGSMLSQSQEGDEIRKFNDRLKASANFVNTSKLYLGDIAKGGVGGTAGDIVKGLSEAFDTARYALKAFKPDADYFNMGDSRWERLSSRTGLAKATLVGMAYTLAASHSQDGRISDNDFKYAMEELGNASSPEKARLVMLRALQTMRGRVDNEYKYLPNDRIRAGVASNYRTFQQDFDSAYAPETFAELEGTIGQPEDSGNAPDGWTEVAPGIFVPKAN